MIGVSEIPEQVSLHRLPYLITYWWNVFFVKVKAFLKSVEIIMIVSPNVYLCASYTGVMHSLNQGTGGCPKRLWETKNKYVHLPGESVLLTLFLERKSKYIYNIYIIINNNKIHNEEYKMYMNLLDTKGVFNFWLVKFLWEPTPGPWWSLFPPLCRVVYLDGIVEEGQFPQAFIVLERSLVNLDAFLPTQLCFNDCGLLKHLLQLDRSVFSLPLLGPAL